MEHDCLISQHFSDDAEQGRAQRPPMSPIEDRISAFSSEEEKQRPPLSGVPPEDSTTPFKEHESLTSGVHEPNKPTTVQATAHQEEEKARIPTAKLRRSGYILLFVLLYSVLAVLAWTILCILTKCPLTTKHYGVDFDTPDGTVGTGGYSWRGPWATHSFYTKNEAWLQAAQVMRSIAAVLTIPLTSAVCSKAAVAFLQQRTNSNISLRQVMVLADRGWTDPIIYFKMLVGGFKRYGTMFLLGATILNILGGVLAPLQAYFVTIDTIKTPRWPSLLAYVADIADQFDPEYMERPSGDNLITVLARSAMTSADVISPQSRLWTGESINCTQTLKKADFSVIPLSCIYGAGNTFTNFTELPDPFLAQLPSGYSTGLIRQYIPRINSTARREIVTEASFPTDCGRLPGAFYVRYGSINPGSSALTGWGNWSLEACMPANLSTSPWRATRKRQDFTEELYLNISLGDPYLTYENTIATDATEQGGPFKITLRTTAGFFELPNYRNGQRPGKLLDDSPVGLCSGDCAHQANIPVDNPNASAERSDVRRANEDIPVISSSSLVLEQLPNRGPLSTIALALFGTGSFIAERIANPDGFVYPNRTQEEIRANPNSYGACVGQVPFMSLLRTDATYQTSNYLEPCLKNDVSNHDDIQRQIVKFVQALYYNYYDGYEINDNSRITNAFTAAAFLANEAWLLSTSGSHTWKVTYDMGADTTVPVLSTTGLFTVSILLGLFLVALLTLAAYSAWAPRWADQLDSFAMLRLGASLAEDIQLKIAHTAGDVSALDKLPGWIGDKTDGEGPVGELGLGAQRRLAANRDYAAYGFESK
ncbi:hypothetical protein LTR56_009857 [Elasticomyces elasticus]|nr:hypothetical protein LTR56_009857 [Elasticomyces elasticus]KAK3659173.1 hypothetical protein LTR22_008636 [Elasticomyces elasticus]KAK4923150.1 hypothetical protein LTR49_009618 [Elasticomyces elasticus]KAK5761535.1 hypothetical protein LTS12_008327 [Elasticomyces elasticus]